MIYDDDNHYKLRKNPTFLDDDFFDEEEDDFEDGETDFEDDEDYESAQALGRFIHRYLKPIRGIDS